MKSNIPLHPRAHNVSSRVGAKDIPMPLLCGFLVLLLTGCGGGSSTSNLPAFPLNPESARALVGGTSLEQTSAQIGARLNTLHQAANSLLIGDNHIFYTDGTIARVATTCTGRASCTTSGGGVSLTLTLENFDFTSSTSNEYQSVMTDRDVPLAQVRAREATSGVSGGQTNTLGYGGWLDHSFFFVQALTQTAPMSDPFTVGFGVSIGNAPGTNPAATGGATWTGVMVGGDVSNTASRGNVIQGDAEIDIDNFANPDVDIRFTNIYDLDSGSTRGDMSWDDIAVTGGAFSTGSGANQIQGKFYGPNHEEVGGVFERNDVVGVFGAQR